MKKKSLLKTACFAIAFLSCTMVKAQVFDSLLNILDTKYQQEKLHVHFDKQLYNPGETVWFKAYIFADNFPSEYSKTVYMELLDEKGVVLQRKTAPVLMSSAASSFDLPNSIQSPLLFVRAYTRWMLNFDSSYLFVKPIRIATAAIPKVTSGSFSLHFFPESGDLIKDVESRVAFKATDNFGYPIRVQGDILDSRGKKVSSFTTMHDGMGLFFLKPLAGEKYKAVWKDPSGKITETVLPESKQEGVVLEVNNLGNNIGFGIKSSANPGTSFVWVVAHMNQKLVYRARAILTGGTIRNGNIPVSSVPAGILQITLFTEQNKPVAERIVFVNHNDYYFITDLNLALKGVEHRKKNVIQIDVPDTLVSNLSVSVTDADLNTTPDEEDIFSSVLLTSDLKGRIHKPAYYFSSSADSLVQHLDLVMMTNGWRRFTWDDVLAGKWKEIKFKPDSYLAIEGKVVGLNKNLLAKYSELTGIFKLKSGGQDFFSMTISPEGTFGLPEALFFDTATIYYQFNNDKNKAITGRATFDIRNNFLNQPVKVPLPNTLLLGQVKWDSLTLAKNRQVFQQYMDVQSAKNAKTLATVVVKTRVKSKKESMDEEYTSGFFRGGDDQTFITEDDPFAKTAFSVLNYLQSRIPGLQVTPGTGMDGAGLTWRGGTPALYLDEMSMSDVNSVASIPMSDIAMVKVFRPPFMGGFGGGNGAIAIYTKKGGNRFSEVKGLDYARIAGYSPIKQFYSPDYSAPDASSEDDLRTTLYWNAWVLTSPEKRRIMLTFHNNDITKRFRVVIEGCNEEGKLTRIEKIFQ